MRKNHILLAIATVFILLLCVPDAVAQTKRYVKTAGVGNNDGSSWSDASGDLQAMIDASNAGDSVFVAAGAYTGQFFMKEGVHVFGGFAADGSELYITSRTGAVDGANASILDGQSKGRVLTQPRSFGTETVWDGFVIRNGDASKLSAGSIIYGATDGTHDTIPAGVVYRYDTSTDGGYMVSLVEARKEWGGYGIDITGLDDLGGGYNDPAADVYNGATATGYIVQSGNHNSGNYAARWCDTLKAGGFENWYLPSLGELVTKKGDADKKYGIYDNRDTLDHALTRLGAMKFSDSYWSGSEFDAVNAWGVNFGNGVVDYDNKNLTLNVRAVRAFNLFSHLSNLDYAGGGVLLHKNGVLRRCVVQDNYSPGMGGGVYAGVGSRVEGCLISSNTATSGSGVYAGKDAVITNSTIVKNSETAQPTRTYEVGQFLYTDGSTSANDATTDVTKELVGVVCWVDPVNPLSGLVLHIAESADDHWKPQMDWAAGLRTANKPWRLPSVGELQLIYEDYKSGTDSKINAALAQLSGVAQLGAKYYWSGSEFDASSAWYVDFNDGVAGNFYKDDVNHYARAVSAFNLLNNLPISGGCAAGENVEISNTLLYGNKDSVGVAKNLSVPSGSSISYTAAETTAPSGGGNTIVADTDFADYTGGNYRLVTTSALIGAGNVPIVPTGLTTDLDNQERIIFGRTDMGAYQSPLIPVTIANPLHVNGYSGLFETTLCDVDSYDLSLTAAGDIYDYTWYREGQQIATTTDSICTITETGIYTVDVNGVLDTVSSGPVTVRFSSSPVITKNLRDAAIVGGHVILTVEATGPGLEYQWYFNNQLITGANTESLTVREEGAYYVQVSNKCGRVLSSTARVTDQMVDPIIKRRIDLPQVEGIVTTPSAGIHYVESRADFFFYMSAAAGYSLDEVTVSTNRDNEVLLEPTDDGRIKVTIKRVNAAITIRIEGVRHGVDNALVPESKVWGSTGVVYFSLPAATDVSVYTLTGTLYERRRLPAGDSRLPMPAGVYLIRLSDGEVHKVIVKN